jgi:hypothetical protein
MRFLWTVNGRGGMEGVRLFLQKKPRNSKISGIRNPANAAFEYRSRFVTPAAEW